MQALVYTGTEKLEYKNFEDPTLRQHLLGLDSSFISVKLKILFELGFVLVSLIDNVEFNKVLKES